MVTSAQSLRQGLAEVWLFLSLDVRARMAPSALWTQVAHRKYEDMRLPDIDAGYCDVAEQAFGAI
jgi:hypothetical protein